MYWLVHKWLTTAVDQPTEQPSQYTDPGWSAWQPTEQPTQYTELGWSVYGLSWSTAEI